MNQRSLAISAERRMKHGHMRENETLAVRAYARQLLLGGTAARRIGRRADPDPQELEWIEKSTVEG